MLVKATWANKWAAVAAEDTVAEAPGSRTEMLTELN